MTLVSKQQTIIDKLKDLMGSFGKKPQQVDDVLTTDPESQSSENAGLKPKPEISDYIAGEISEFKDELSPFLPVELIAGEVPYILGMEVETVWNAASQACGTEKVHFAYSVDLTEEKITYLACPSSTLSSAPDSWCPLVAALPGNPEFIDKQTVYVYEQDASTGALRWNDETGRVQLFVGGSRTIIPKIQSMDTNFVTIGKDNPNVIAWKNRQLKTEKLARALIRALLFSGIGVSLLLITILVLDAISLFFAKKDLSDVTQETKKVTTQLVEESYKAMHSDIIQHNVRIQQLLDELYKINGTLVKYEVSKGQVTWEALVPPEANFSKTGGKKVDDERSSKDGRERIKGTK